MLLSAGLFCVCALPSVLRAQEAEANDEYGWTKPTLDGDWRFLIAPYGWAPDHIRIDADLPDGSSGGLTLGIGDLLDALRGAAEVETEVHKGSFGYFADIIWLSLDFTKNAGPFDIDIDDDVVLLSTGPSFELGRWKLRDLPGEPVVRVLPFIGIRTLLDTVKIDLPRAGRPTVRINFVTPIVGARALVDFTERWNLRLEADYGGANIDDVRYTWQAIAAIGYRFHIGSVRSNLLAGYRGLGVNTEDKGVELTINARGGFVGLGFEF